MGLFNEAVLAVEHAPNERNNDCYYTFEAMNSSSSERIDRDDQVGFGKGICKEDRISLAADLIVMSSGISKKEMIVNK